VSLPGSSLPPLLWRNALRYHWQHRWQTLLSVLGILLGVMMVVAVDLASTSARRAFELSVESVSGTITHQVVGGSQGVPEHIFTQLRTELGLRRSAPVLTAEVRLQGQSLTLLGLDLVSEASLQRRLPGLDGSALDLTRLAAGALRADNAILLPAAVATQAGLAVDAVFNLNPPHAELPLTLAGTLDNMGSSAAQMAFADIAVAQRLLQRTGRLDSIDLVLTDAQADTLRRWLPADVTLVEAAGRNAALTQMTEAFHVNLLAMSLLALLVAALLIYNTVSLSVLERRAGFGVLRALGLRRRELGQLILVETAVLGVVASALGVAAGVWLGSFLVELVTRTIDDLYFSLSVREYLVQPLLLLKGFGWGLGLTLLAAAVPALQAGRSPPITLQQRGQDGLALQRRLPWFTALAVVLLLAGIVVLRAGGDLVQGFVALFLLVFGFCLLVPQLLHLLMQVLLRSALVRSTFALRLALRAIQSGLDRTALAVAALTVAVSVTVGVGLMVSSLRDTVLLWLDQTLPGDIQVTQVEADAGISPAVRALVAQQAAVVDVLDSWLVNTESNLGALRVQSAAGPLESWLFLKEGSLPDDNSVLISEPLASLHQLAIGDNLQLLTAAGTRTLRISGVFYDYNTGTPFVAVSSAQLQNYWPEAEARRLTLSLREGADAEALAEALRTALRNRDDATLVMANSTLHAVTLAIFDRTFAITHVLRILALVVAFVGVFSAMLALQLQRLRDYAILRAGGMTLGEVARLIVLQTVVMGTLAGLLALPLGLLMSDVLIDVINMRSFGWSMLHSLPPSVLVEALMLAIVAAVLAGLYPARRVAEVHPAQALRGE
jgi:putative ABC transport system permease protein